MSRAGYRAWERNAMNDAGSDKIWFVMLFYYFWSKHPTIMNKHVLLLTALTIASLASAQENRLSVGLEAGLPIGDFGDVTTFGIGASVGYEVPVGDNLGVVAQVGYLYFAGKDYSIGIANIDGPNWSVIPAQVGAKYYFTENQEGFYAMGLVGIHALSYTVPGFSATLPEVTVSDTQLSFAPGLGYVVGENIDLALRYQIISGDGGSLSYMGVRAAYLFGSR